MKEHPILFNGDMIRAILEERKTQTRRPIKNLPECTILDIKREPNFQDPLMPEWLLKKIKCPFGQPGDRLWVRETFFCNPCLPNCAGRSNENECPFNHVGDKCYGYRTQYTDISGIDVKWRPSIHMPRWASRIILEIDEIRVERAQDITEDGARAEGVKPLNNQPYQSISHRMSFSVLWDSIYSKQDLGWEVNPWVWTVKFHVLEG
jgi:hypothetical protein